MITGTPKFDSLAVREVTVEFKQMGQVHLTCKAAFVNSTDGNTYGWTRGEGNWSKETIERLQVLRESMELDLSMLHLTNTSVRTDLPASPRKPAELGGIGEYLQEVDQV